MKHEFIAYKGGIQLENDVEETAMVVSWAIIRDLVENVKYEEYER
ncbi:hypothetical protein [Candidatus Azobacteroides pseudotrichonymphae]|nr:hypothetical protein [Candidatus Azobacteroides pseudotrichonymphae]